MRVGDTPNSHIRLILEDSVGGIRVVKKRRLSFSGIVVSWILYFVFVAWIIYKFR
jgi:hypothetical protein